INWRNLTPPELAERDRQAMAEIEERRICTSFEKEFIRKDGTPVPVLVGGALLGDSQNRGVAWIVDLTVRKRAEAATQRLALLFDNLHDAVVFTDFDGRIIEWNPAAETMFGFSRAE